MVNKPNNVTRKSDAFPQSNTVLRMTPDHGPNIKMIGKNKSNPLSLIRALNFLDQ